MEQLRARLNSVPDPEIPVLTLNDLGIIRQLQQTENGYELTITPTYSGCPAVDRMKSDLMAAARECGIEQLEIKVSYTPAWSTEWMSDEAKKRLKNYGIAPPKCNCSSTTCKRVQTQVQCPRCDSENTRLISEFGSTACKSLYQCNDCLEPFEYFKHH